MQSTTSFGGSDAQGYKVDGYTTAICSAVISSGGYTASALKTSSDVTTPPFGQRAPLYYSPGYSASLYDYKGEAEPWSEPSLFLTGIPLQQGMLISTWPLTAKLII